jgi:hypothetical protein
MTSREENARFLLILNLGLQIVDGTLSYGLSFAVGAPDLAVNTATITWAMVLPLVYNKALAATLLLLIYTLRHGREVMVANALTIIASIYTCHTTVSLWRYCAP